MAKGENNEKTASQVCVTSIYYHFIWQIWKLQTFNWNILNISKKEQKKEKKIKIKLKVWRVNLRNSKDNQLTQRVKTKQNNVGHLQKHNLDNLLRNTDT